MSEDKAMRNLPAELRKKGPPRFKVGDAVVCVHLGDMSEGLSQLERGKRYKIRDVQQDKESGDVGLLLKGVKNPTSKGGEFYYHESRFKSAEQYDSDRNTETLLQGYKEPWESDLWSTLNAIRISHASMRVAREFEATFEKLVQLSGQLRKKKLVADTELYERKLYDALLSNESGPENLGEQDLRQLSKAIVSRLYRDKVGKASDEIVREEMQKAGYHCFNLKEEEEMAEQYSINLGTIIAQRVRHGDMSVLATAAEGWERALTGKKTLRYMKEPPSLKHVQAFVLSNRFRAVHGRNPTNAELLEFGNPILESKGLSPLKGQDLSKAKKTKGMKSLFK